MPGYRLLHEFVIDSKYVMLEVATRRYKQYHEKKDGNLSNL